jgi:hypothetical protein
MCTVSAQTSTSNKTESLGSKISRILNRARKSVNKAGKQVGYTLDADGRLNKENDLIKVSGLYYMPLYTVNLYQGKEAAEFRETVRKKFMEKYPQTKLQTVVIPQTDWLHEPVEKGDVIIGYLQTMYCYAIAQDGEEGYINAKFTFQRYREVGGEYQPLQEKWPKWERTDVLSDKVYNKLLTK